jgi:hypothetical protein
LIGFEATGLVPSPLYLRGIKSTPFQDGLFSGCDADGEASTNIYCTNSLEVLQRITNNMEIVVDISALGFATNAPIMLRYPAFTQPDFGEPRRLVQDFRVTSPQPPQSQEELDSRTARRILFVNGVCWLLRTFECANLSVGLDCVQPSIPAGIVGSEVTLSTLLDQNGACTAGGVVFSNHFSPRLQILRADLVPGFGVLTNNYQIDVYSNDVVVRFAQLPRNSFYELRTTAIPRIGGWLTNICTATRGLYEATPCSQPALIQGPPCTAVTLTAVLGTNNSLHILVRGGVGCAFQVEASTDLQNWGDLMQVQSDSEPYDVPLPSASGSVQFFRLRKLE